MMILPVHIAYGSLSLFISILNNVFLLFYVTVFTLVFKIDRTWFFIGEALFLLWNSINDPLFGWLSDSNLMFGPRRKHNDVVLMRIHALARYGPLFALSFLLFWFHILPVGLQFSLALCFYDGFLTMVDLNHQALLADLAVKSTSRVQLNFYCSAFSAMGSTSVFIAFALWNELDLFYFQSFCVCLSALVCFGFHVCCNSLEQFYNTVQTLEHHEDKYKQKNSKPKEISLVAAKIYISQVLHHKNFLVFATMNLVQVFHCHFNSNFFPLFVQHLLGHVISPRAGAVIIGLSFLVPHINNLYFLQFCKSYGSFSVIRCLFIVKLLLAVFAWSLGTSNWYFLCLFIISNRVFTEGTCKLCNIVITNLVDEDFVKFRRKTPIAALVFGTSALLTKPGQTIAPLLGSYLLYLYTGKSLFFSGTGESVAGFSEKTIDDVGYAKFKEGCFSLLVLISIVTALVQLFTWQFFTLRDRYLQKIKLDRIVLETGYNQINLV